MALGSDLSAHGTVPYTKVRSLRIMKTALPFKVGTNRDLFKLTCRVFQPYSGHGGQLNRYIGASVEPSFPETRFYGERGGSKMFHSETQANSEFRSSALLPGLDFYGHDRQSASDEKTINEHLSR